MSMLCWAPLHRGVLTTGTGLAHGDWQQHREAVVCADPRTAVGLHPPGHFARDMELMAAPMMQRKKVFSARGCPVQGGVQFGAGLMVG